MDQGEGRRGGRAQARSGRLRAVEGAQAGRGHGLGRALGARPARLAHRVLGDGRGSCSASGSRSTAAASDLIFPHHENEAAQTRAAHGVPLTKLWVHNGMVRLDQTKMSKSVGNIFLLHQALDAYGRDALIMYFCGEHYRQPVEFDDERLTEAQARVERIREAGAPAGAGALAGVVGAAARAVLRRARQRLQHACGARGGVRLGAGGEPRRARQRRRRPARDARRARARRPARGGRRRRHRPRWQNSPTRASRPARQRDYAEADRLREAIRAHGWEVRDGPDGPELLPAA